MFVFLLPFVIVIGTLVMTGRHSEAKPQLAIAGDVRDAPPPGRVCPPGRPGPAPSPIAVLSDFVRANAQPPAIVVQCAIAQAEIMGRADLALALTRQYVIPALASQSPAGGGAAPEAQTPPPGSPTTPPPERVIEAAPQAPGAAPAQSMQPPVYTRSPLPGVPDGAWQAFAQALVRESPDFDGPRHVGRYRHRKDRLAEIGFDPSILPGVPHVQDDAFAADVADSFRHLAKSGTLDQVIGRPVNVPAPDGSAVVSVPISLSGMLGLASVAGLEGAIEWLGSPEDRKRYPHTTQAFMRCNGAF